MEISPGGIQKNVPANESTNLLSLTRCFISSSTPTLTVHGCRVLPLFVRAEDPKGGFEVDFCFFSASLTSLCRPLFTALDLFIERIVWFSRTRSKFCHSCSPKSIVPSESISDENSTMCLSVSAFESCD